MRGSKLKTLIALMLTLSVIHSRGADLCLGEADQKALAKNEIEFKKLESDNVDLKRAVTACFDTFCQGTPQWRQPENVMLQWALFFAAGFLVSEASK